jgi:cytochrome c-type biogenesis protein
MSSPPVFLGAAFGGAGSLVDHSPLGFVVAFGAGVVSFLSPCVLPLVPSYLSMMSGVGNPAAPRRASAADRTRVVWSAVLFVAGFSLVFAILEAGASTLAQPLRAHEHVLDYVAGGLIIAFGLLLAGLLQLPWLQREHRFVVKPSRLGPFAAPLMGMAFAFGWTPCIGPVLAAVLGLASSASTLGRGEAMLVAYSLGLGVPFIVLGLAFGRLSGALSFARRHSRGVALVSGLFLAALGVGIVTGQVGTVSSWFASALRFLGLASLATS